MKKEFLGETEAMFLLESISPTFYERFFADIPFAKFFLNLNNRTKKLLKSLSYEKAARIMLVKLTLVLPSLSKMNE